MIEEKLRTSSNESAGTNNQKIKTNTKEPPTQSPEQQPKSSDDKPGHIRSAIENVQRISNTVNKIQQSTELTEPGQQPKTNPHPVSNVIKKAGKVVVTPGEILRGAKKTANKGLDVYDFVKEALDEGKEVDPASRIKTSAKTGDIAEGKIMTSATDPTGTKGGNGKIKTEAGNTGDVKEGSEKFRFKNAEQSKKSKKRQEKIKTIAKGVSYIEDTTSTDPEAQLRGYRQILTAPARFVGRKVGNRIKTGVGNWADKKIGDPLRKKIINPVKDKVVNPVKGWVNNHIKHPIKDLVKKGLQMTIRGIAKLLGALINIISMGITVIVPILCVFVIIMMLFSYQGSDESIQLLQEMFERLDKREEQRFRTYMGSEAKEGLKLNVSVPGKKEFEGISDEAYEEMKETWRKDEVSQVSVFNNNYEALVFMYQFFYHPASTSTESESIKSFESVCNYWIDSGAWNEFSTISTTDDYTITWNKVTETEKEVEGEDGKTKKEKVTEVEEMSKDFSRTVNNVFITPQGIESLVACTIEGLENDITIGTGQRLSQFFDIDELKTAQKNGIENFVSSLSQENIFMDRFDDQYSGTYTSSGDYLTGAEAGGVNVSSGRFPYTLAQINNDNVFASSPHLIGYCTHIAAGVYNQLHPNAHLPHSVCGPACTWYYQAANAGMSVGQAAKPGAIIVYSGSSGGVGGAGNGHVAVVMNIKMDGDKITSITIAQGNVGAPSEAAINANPLGYTTVTTHKSLEEFESIYCKGLTRVGFIY